MPKNILKSLIDEASSKITEEIKTVNDKFEDLSNKIENATAKEKYVAAIEERKSSLKEWESSMIKSFKVKLSNLGIKLGLLQEATSEFASRLASIPSAVICTTPAGPGVSTNLIPILIKQLKGEGDNLAAIISDVKVLSLDIGLDNFTNVSGISSIISTKDTIVNIATTACKVVGSSVDDIEGDVVSVDSPDLEITYEASSCSNYIYVNAEEVPEEEYPTPDASNCKSFKAIDSSISEYSCNNCKYYRVKSS